MTLDRWEKFVLNNRNLRKLSAPYSNFTYQIFEFMWVAFQMILCQFHRVDIFIFSDFDFVVTQQANVVVCHFFHRVVLNFNHVFQTWSSRDESEI